MTVTLPKPRPRYQLLTCNIFLTLYLLRANLKLMELTFRNREKDIKEGDNEDKDEQFDEDNNCDNNEIPSGCGHYCHYIYSDKVYSM